MRCERKSRPARFESSGQEEGGGIYFRVQNDLHGTAEVNNREIKNLEPYSWRALRRIEHNRGVPRQWRQHVSEICF